MAPAYSSVHATMNAAVKLRLAGGSTGASASPATISSATVVLGFHSGTGWVAHRWVGAERRGMLFGHAAKACGQGREAHLAAGQLAV